MKCLIVEDDEAQRLEYMRIVHDLGFSCHDTDRIAQALYLLKSNRFDVILLDWHVQDGMTVQLVDFIEFRGDAVVIILITGGGEFPNGEISSIWPRIDYVVRKPVNLSDLSALLSYAIPTLNENLREGISAQPPVAPKKRGSR